MTSNGAPKSRSILLNENAEHDHASVALSDPLRLMEDADQINEAFAKWHKLLLKHAVQDGNALRLIEERISFRRLPSNRSLLWLEFRVGTSEDATIQINEPKSAGSGNPLSGIGVSRDGHRFLLRQADLQANNASERIRGKEFAERTGLPIVPVLIDGRAAKRQWHVVTPLDAIGDRFVRAATADFVDRCWAARTWGSRAAHDQQRLERLFGRREVGGWMVITPDPTPRTVLRAQGEVWQKLKLLLEAFGIEMRKPRHARGYEVDAEILSRNGSLLVEVKSSTASADVYGGIGQLTIYRVLLRDLATHARILLLPGKPSEELAKALTMCGIELHWFRLKQQGAQVDVRFSREFLRRCGVPTKKLAELRAL